jgi:hypothetical protein
VGEHSKHSYKKGPLLFTTAFLVLYPVCLAQAATSSFQKTQVPYSPYGHYARSGQHPVQTGLGIQQSSLPKSYPSLHLLSQSSPSVDDFNTLNNTLQSLQNKLQTLVSQKDSNPSSDLDKAITNVENKISALKTKISLFNQSLTSVKDAQATLTKALSTLADRQTTLTTSQSTLSTAKGALQDATNAKTSQDAVTTASKTTLDVAKQTYQDSLDAKVLSDASLTHQQDVTAQAQENLRQAQASVDTATTDLSSAQQTFNEASSKAEAASASLSVASTAEAQAHATLDATSSKLQTKQDEVTAFRETFNGVVANYNQLIDTYNTVYANYVDAQAKQQQAQQDLNQAQANLDQAQANYDNNLIPDPTWTPTTYQQVHTKQVPTTTLVPVTTTTLTGGLTADSFNRQNYGSRPPLPASNEVPIATLNVPNINYQWGGGQVLNSGKYDRVLVRFTGNISFPDTQDVRFYAPGDDGVQLYIDGALVINDWMDKGGGGSQSNYIHFEAGSTHTITLYFYENGGGANVWLYYATPTTGFQIVPAAYLGTTATTTTTYVEQTTYTTETYYTTEVIPGQTAPLINDASLLPALKQAQVAYASALAAFNEADSKWQEAQVAQQTAASNTTAGYYQVIDTANTLNTASAELDVYQNEFNTAKANYNQASQDLQAAQTLNENASTSVLAAGQTLNEAKSKVLTANSQLQTAQDTYSTEAQKSQAMQTSNEQASLNVKSNKLILDKSQTDYESQTAALQQTTLNEASAQQAVADAQSQVNQAQSQVDTATQTKTTAEGDLQSSQTSNEASFNDASSAASDATSGLSDATTIYNTPQGSPEIPVVLNADNLMNVDLTQVDPTQLSPEQATQLVEAALETFNTATEGSPEYQQALDALALAAQQDDIQVDPQLASIPGVGQAAQAVVAVFNIIGNVGADISPKVRKKAQTLVVTTLVVGQIAQTAALATASSGGSSNRTNRINRRK